MEDVVVVVVGAADVVVLDVVVGETVVVLDDDVVVAVMLVVVLVLLVVVVGATVVEVDVVVPGTDVLVVLDVLVLLVVVEGDEVVVVLPGNAPAVILSLRISRATNCPVSSAPALIRRSADGAQTPALTRARREKSSSAPSTNTRTPDAGTDSVAGPRTLPFSRRRAPATSRYCRTIQEYPGSPPRTQAAEHVASAGQPKGARTRSSTADAHVAVGPGREDAGGVVPDNDGLRWVAGGESHWKPARSADVGEDRRGDGLRRPAARCCLTHVREQLGARGRPVQRD